MTRLENWPSLLAAWVERVRDRPFHWGEWDCAIAASDAILAITGEDPLAGLRWADAKGAARQLDAEGGLEAGVTARLGAPIAAASAQRGDLVLMLNPESEKASREFVAVCLGHVAAAPSAVGLAFPEMRHAIKAWAVGR